MHLLYMHADKLIGANRERLPVMACPLSPPSALVVLHRANCIYKNGISLLSHRYRPATDPRLTGPLRLSFPIKSLNILRYDQFVLSF